MVVNAQARVMEVKTSLSESHYNAMLEVIDALGMSQAGYIRTLILRDICQSQELVERMAAITARSRTGRNKP